MHSVVCRFLARASRGLAVVVEVHDALIVTVPESYRRIDVSPVIHISCGQAAETAAYHRAA